MKKFLIYYDFIIVSLVVLAGFFNAQSYIDLISAIPFLPLVVYFGIFIFPRKRRAIILPQKSSPKKVLLAKPSEITANEEKKVVQPPAVDGEILEEEKEGIDSNRRMFLKLIGSAGLSVFFFALFTKKAEAAFFGSVPGPGTMALKNTAGEKIDPAEKSPTDGYNINQVDDTSDPPYAYYGFTNKGGAWFIMRETTSGVDEGQYRYRIGSSNFPAGWSARADNPETYDYFDEVF